MTKPGKLNIYFASQIFAICALLLLLKLGLLPALLAGLLIYQLVQTSTKLFAKIGVTPLLGQIFSLIIISIVVIFGIVLGSIELTAFIKSGSGGGVALMQKMADAIEIRIGLLPDWMQDYLPTNINDLQKIMAGWLRENSAQLSHIGRSIGTSIVYILTGMIIGGMVAINHNKTNIKLGVLPTILKERVCLLSNSFQRIVFSQVKISTINTCFTTIFITIIFPLFNVQLPMKTTIIAITFIAGLLPVLGNLISNTVIFLISFGVSSGAAFGALAFLVIIHKLEYFLNAHIIGTNISARAWEILLAMIAMEAMFGLSGIIAAPIYYAYLKDELNAQKLL